MEKIIITDFVCSEHGEQDPVMLGDAPCCPHCISENWFPTVSDEDDNPD